MKTEAEIINKLIGIADTIYKNSKFPEYNKQQLRIDAGMAEILRWVLE